MKDDLRASCLRMAHERGEPWPVTIDRAAAYLKFLSDEDIATTTIRISTEAPSSEASDEFLRSLPLKWSSYFTLTNWKRSIMSEKIRSKNCYLFDGVEISCLLKCAYSIRYGNEGLTTWQQIADLGPENLRRRVNFGLVALAGTILHLRELRMI
jgi:hypothetical protein